MMAHRESHDARELREEVHGLREELKAVKRDGSNADIRDVKRELLAREKELSDALASQSDGW